MHADTSAHPISAARRRHEEARKSAVHAIRAAHSRGQRPSISALAATAGGSRSFLYANSDLFEARYNLRPEPSKRPSTSVQASHDVLLSRLAALTEKNNVLRAENDGLRRALEAAHGVLRDQDRGLAQENAS